MITVWFAECWAALSVRQMCERTPLIVAPQDRKDPMSRSVFHIHTVVYSMFCIQWPQLPKFISESETIACKTLHLTTHFSNVNILCSKLLHTQSKQSDENTCISAAAILKSIEIIIGLVYKCLLPECDVCLAELHVSNADSVKSFEKVVLTNAC